MRGTSKVIVIFLISIGIIAFIGLVYLYSSSVFVARTGKIVEIDSGATFCSGTTITVYIKSIGSIDFTANDVNIHLQQSAAKTCSNVTDTVVAGRETYKCNNVLVAADGVQKGNNMIVASAAAENGPTNTDRADVLCSD